MSRLSSVWGPGEHHPAVPLRLAPRGVLWVEQGGAGCSDLAGLGLLEGNREC